ncbi:MAG: RNA polymerase sigma factor [Rhizobiaceae bacterium]
MDEAQSDRALVMRAVGGDRAAFAALVSRHYDFALRTAFKWSGNREDAEDIAQDVCVRLGRSIRSFDGRAQFSTWLYRVVLNAARDFQRRGVSEKRKLDEWAVEPARPQVQAAYEAEDEGDRLWQAVRQLPPKQRDALLLVYGEELSHADAAGVMGCAEGTVSFHLHEGRKRLRDMMSAEDDMAAGAVR